MPFTVPAVVVSKNSAGSVTSTAGTFASAVAAGTPLVIGISVSSDTPAISSVADSKGNAYTLAGHQATTTGQPAWIYKAWVTTPLTTSDTLTVTISSGAVINFIGVAGPGTLFVPVQFTAAADTVAAASFQLSVPALPSAANGYVIAFSVNASAAPTWLTPGPTVLATTSGGGGPFFSCAYEDAGDFPALLEIDLAPSSTATMAATALMSEYTDLYADAYSSLYGQFTGTPWPRSGPLELEVDLLLNGTWTDITSYVYQRDGSVNVGITFGQPDESSKLVTAKCTLQLNNRGGTFTGKNTASPFYPYITRNTQIRVLVPASWNSTDAGLAYAFSGEVSSWPKSRDTSGNDVWCDITASGISRRLNQAGNLGSALSRWYLQKDPSDPLYPVAYWPMEDGSTSATLAEVTGAGSPATFTGTPTLASDASFGGSDPLPALNGAVITCLTGPFGDPGSATFTSPGTHSFVPRDGLTSLTAAECWAGGGGGTNGYQANNNMDAAGGGGEYAKETAVAVTAGTAYTVTVGAGGAGGPLATIATGLRQRQGANGGTSSFPGDAVTVTAHGGGGGLFTGTRSGKGGTGSANATHHNGGNGGKNSGLFYGGSGGGSSGGTAAAGNNGTGGGASNTGAAGGAAVTGGGAGGKGGNGGAADQGGTAGAVPGAGGGSGGMNAGSQAAHGGGNGGAGKVKLSWTPLAAPAGNFTRFLLHVPAGGDTNNAVVCQYLTGGVVATVILTYTTASSGTLTLTGKNAGGGLLFTSAGITGVNGVPFMVSMELVPGATVGYVLRVMPANNPSSQTATGGTASASGGIGGVPEVDVNPGGALTSTSFGHLLVQYSSEALSSLAGSNVNGLGPVSGWAQERAGRRFIRLCSEEGVQYAIPGNVDATPAMGPQPDDKLINVLQQIPDLDGGLLYEPASVFGLAYRTLASMTAQHPKVIADYSLAQLSAPFLPTEDDLLTRNIVTVSRVNGSSVTVRQSAGALSYLAPPDGAGQYPFPLTVNAYADSQLAGVAARILELGTVDDDRYPAVNFQLSRSAAAELYAQVVAMIPGDYLRVVNGPADLTSADINQLAFGFTWTISGFRFDVALACVPEAPFAS
jgi:hypothetical protein